MVASGSAGQFPQEQGIQEIIKLRFVFCYHFISVLYNKIWETSLIFMSVFAAQDSINAPLSPLLFCALVCSQFILHWCIFHCPRLNFDLLSIHKLEKYALEFHPAEKLCLMSGDWVIFKMSEIHIGLVCFVSPQQQVFNHSWWLKLNALGQDQPRRWSFSKPYKL